MIDETKQHQAAREALQAVNCRHSDREGGATCQECAIAVVMTLQAPASGRPAEGTERCPACQSPDRGRSGAYRGCWHQWHKRDSSRRQPANPSPAARQPLGSDGEITIDPSATPSPALVAEPIARFTVQPPYLREAGIAPIETHAPCLYTQVKTCLQLYPGDPDHHCSYCSGIATATPIEANSSQDLLQKHTAPALVAEARQLLARLLGHRQPCGCIECQVTRNLQSLADLCDQQAARLREVEAERDEARRIVADVNNSVFGSQGYFTTPNCVEAVEKVKFGANQARAQLATAHGHLRTLTQEACDTYDPESKGGRCGYCDQRELPHIAKAYLATQPQE